MKTVQALLFFLGLTFQVFSQNTDPLSYHNSRQLSDTSYSIKKTNGDSTIFLFESTGFNNKRAINNLNVDNIPIYNNQDTAIKYGLVKGDLYRLPADVNNNRLLAIVDNISDSNFNFIVDNSSNNTHLIFRIHGYGIYDMMVDWGDGSTPENFSGNSEFTPDHAYTTAGIYHVTCTFNDYSLIEWLNIGIDFSNTCNVSSFHNLQLFTHLVEADIEGTGMKLWSYSDGFAYSINDFWFSQNNFNSIELNKLLVYLDSLSFNTGPKQLFIHAQRTGEGPTGIGLTAITSLESKGWTVTY